MSLPYVVKQELSLYVAEQGRSKQARTPLKITSPHFNGFRFLIRVCTNLIWALKHHFQNIGAKIQNFLFLYCKSFPTRTLVFGHAFRLRSDSFFRLQVSLRSNENVLTTLTQKLCNRKFKSFKIKYFSI